MSHFFQPALDIAKAKHTAWKWRDAGEWERLRANASVSARPCADIILSHLAATPGSWIPDRTLFAWQVPDLSRHLDVSSLLGLAWTILPPGDRQAVFDHLAAATPNPPWLRVVFLTLDSLDLALIMPTSEMK